MFMCRSEGRRAKWRGISVEVLRCYCDQRCNDRANLVVYASVAEQADARDLKSLGIIRTGSSPVRGTTCSYFFPFFILCPTYILSICGICALLAKLADAQDLGSCVERRDSSNLSGSTSWNSSLWRKSLRGEMCDYVGSCHSVFGE